MKRRLSGVLMNPLTRVIPLVLILAIAWQHYTYAGRALSLPSKQNLLSDMIVNPAVSALPAGWTVSGTGDAHYDVVSAEGYTNGTASELKVTDYKIGDVTLMTPKMNVKPDTTYLFKGYYEASTQFDVLAHYFYLDGTDEIRFKQSYPDNKGVWSTVSDAFTSSKSVASVQYIYRVTSNGSVKIDGMYLEPRQDVYVTTDPKSGQNLVPNSALEVGDNVLPDHWSTYRIGDNDAAFSYAQDEAGPYLHTVVSNYHDGEAKWEHEPVPVSPFQYYQFGVTYKSDVPVDVVAEYTTTDGQQVFDTLEKVAPSGNWTRQTFPIEVPDNVSDMFVSLVLHDNGTLGTRDYTLVNKTKPGALQWDRPLASITFDDGWKSSFNNALPLLDKNDFKATFYINPASIETPDFMTAADLQVLNKDGNEVAAHGYEHDDMTAISASKLEYDLHEGRDYLAQAGYKTADFATPYGKSDAEVQYFARKYYATLRGTDTGVNTRQNLDPYDLQVLYQENSTKPAEIQAALDQAKATHGWVIFVYHRIGPAHATSQTLKVESPSITTDSVAKQFTIIHDSGITVEPIDQAFAEVRNQ